MNRTSSVPKFWIRVNTLIWKLPLPTFVSQIKRLIVQGELNSFITFIFFISLATELLILIPSECLTLCFQGLFTFCENIFLSTAGQQFGGPCLGISPSG